MLSHRGVSEILHGSHRVPESRDAVCITMALTRASLHGPRPTVHMVVVVHGRAGAPSAEASCDVRELRGREERERERNTDTGTIAESGTISNHVITAHLGSIMCTCYTAVFSHRILVTLRSPPPPHPLEIFAAGAERTG